MFKIICEKGRRKIYAILRGFGISDHYIQLLRSSESHVLKNGEKSKVVDFCDSNDVLEINETLGDVLEVFEDAKKMILFEDELILIVSKPAMLSTIPSRKHFENNLSRVLMKKGVFRCANRLDRETAGLVVIFKSLFAASIFSNVHFEKTYVAIAKGQIDCNQTISLPIATVLNEHGFHSQKRVVSESGKAAITHVFPIIKTSAATFLHVVLETGRTHQIRLHLSAIGHPLIGDCVYGEKSSMISHTALVCKKIVFIHPLSKIEMKVEAEFEEDFSALIEMLF